MKKFITATLKGGQEFGTHKEAKSVYDGISGSPKGVFEVKEDKRGLSVESVNVSADGFFSIMQQQLKEVAKMIASSEEGKMTIDAQAVKLKGGDQFVGAVKKEGDFVFIGTRNEEIPNENIQASYPVQDRLNWIDEEGIVQLDDKELKLMFLRDNNMIMNATAGTAMLVKSPYVIVEEEPDILSREEMDNVLKASIHRMVENYEAAKSIGIDPKDLIPLPATESFLLRDSEAPDVFNKVSDIYSKGETKKVEISSVMGESEDPANEMTGLKR